MSGGDHSKVVDIIGNSKTKIKLKVTMNDRTCESGLKSLVKGRSKEPVRVARPRPCHWFLIKFLAPVCIVDIQLEAEEGAPEGAQWLHYLVIAKDAKTLCDHELVKVIDGELVVRPGEPWFWATEIEVMKFHPPNPGQNRFNLAKIHIRGTVHKPRQSFLDRYFMQFPTRESLPPIEWYLHYGEEEDITKIIYQHSDDGFYSTSGSGNCIEMTFKKPIPISGLYAKFPFYETGQIVRWPDFLKMDLWDVFRVKWVSAVRLKPSLTPAADGTASLQVRFDEVWATKAKFWGWGSLHWDICFQKIDFLVNSRGREGRVDRDEPEKVYEQSGDLIIKPSMYLYTGILSLLRREELLGPWKVENGKKILDFPGTVVAISGVVFKSGGVATLHGLGVDQTHFLFHLNEADEVWVDLSDLEIRGLCVEPDYVPFEVEIFGTIKHEAVPGKFSVCDPMTFPLGTNARAGFLYTLRQCNQEYLYRVRYEDEQGPEGGPPAKAMVLSFPTGIFQCQHLFCQVLGTVDAMTSRGPITFQIRSLVTKIDQTASTFRFSPGITLEHIELFGTFNFLENEQTSRQEVREPRVDYPYLMRWAPGSKSLEDALLPEYVTRFASKDVHAPNCSGTINSEEHFVEYRYGVRMIPSLIVLSANLRDFSAEITQVKFKQVHEEDWRPLPYQLVDYDSENTVFYILVTQRLAYQELRISFSHAEVVVDYVKTWGSFTPVDEYMFTREGQDIHYHSLSSSSLFLMKYGAVTGTKIDRKTANFSLDGIEIAISRFYGYRPPQSFDIEVQAVGHTKKVVASVRDGAVRDLTRKAETQFFGSNISLTTACGVFDIPDCIVRSRLTQGTSGDIVCPFRLCPDAGLLASLKSCFATLCGQMVVTCGPNLVCGCYAECLSEDKCKDDLTMVVAFAGHLVTPTTFCVETDRYAVVESIIGVTQEGHDEEIPFTKVKWSRIMVLNMECNQEQQYISIRIRFSRENMVPMDIVISHFEFFGRVLSCSSMPLRDVVVAPEQLYGYRLDKRGVLEAFEQCWAKDLVRKRIENNELIVDFTEVELYPTHVFLKDGDISDCRVMVSDEGETWSPALAVIGGSTVRSKGAGGRFVKVTSNSDLPFEKIEFSGKICWNCPLPEPNRSFKMRMNPFNGVLRSGKCVNTYVGPLGTELVLTEVDWDNCSKTFTSNPPSFSLDFQAEQFSMTSCAFKWSERLEGDIELSIMTLTAQGTWEVQRFPVNDNDNIVRVTLGPARCYHFVFEKGSNPGFLQYFDIFGEFSPITVERKAIPHFDIARPISVGREEGGFDLIEAVIDTFDGRAGIVDIQPASFVSLYSKNLPYFWYHVVSRDETMELTFPGGELRSISASISYLGVNYSDFELNIVKEDGVQKVVITFRKAGRISKLRIYGTYTRLPCKLPSLVVGSVWVKIGPDPRKGVLDFIGKRFTPSTKEIELAPFYIQPEMFFIDADGDAEISFETATGWKPLPTIAASQRKIYRAENEPIRRIKVDGNVKFFELYGLVHQESIGRLLLDCTKGLFHKLDVDDVRVMSSHGDSDIGILLHFVSDWDNRSFLLPGPCAKLDVKFKRHLATIEGFGIRIHPRRKYETSFKLEALVKGSWTKIFEVSRAEGLICHKFPQPISDVSKLCLSASNSNSIVIGGMEFYGTVQEVANSKDTSARGNLPKEYPRLFTRQFSSEASPGLFADAKRIFADSSSPVFLPSFKLANSLVVMLTDQIVAALDGVFLSVSSSEPLALYGSQGKSLVKLAVFESNFSGYQPIERKILIDSLLLVGHAEITKFEIYGDVCKDASRGVLPQSIKADGYTYIDMEGLLFNGILAAVRRNAAAFSNNTTVKCSTGKRVGNNAPPFEVLFEQPHLVSIDTIVVRVVSQSAINPEDQLKFQFRTEDGFWTTIARFSGPFMPGEAVICPCSADRPCTGVKVFLKSRTGKLDLIEMFGALIMLPHDEAIPLVIDPPTRPLAEILKSAEEDGNPRRVYLENMKELTQAVVNPGEGQKSTEEYERLVRYRNDLFTHGFERQNVFQLRNWNPTDSGLCESIEETCEEFCRALKAAQV